MIGSQLEENPWSFKPITFQESLTFTIMEKKHKFTSVHHFKAKKERLDCDYIQLYNLL